MKLTYRRSFEFGSGGRIAGIRLGLAHVYLANNKDETKVAYSMQRSLVQMRKIEQTYLDAGRAIDRQFCATNEKGIVLKDVHGNFDFTKEDLTNRDNAVMALLNSEIEFTQYLATSIPQSVADTLTYEQLECFDGIVISHEDVERILAEREQRAGGVKSPQAAQEQVM